MSDNRVRLSVLADELGVDFGGLFGEFCRLFPGHIDSDITVPAAWSPLLATTDSWLPALEMNVA